MNKETLIAEIKAVVVKHVGDIKNVQLSDILYALARCPYQFKTELGESVLRFDDEGSDWVLLNQFEDQPIETLQGLHNLLCKHE